MPASAIREKVNDFKNCGHESQDSCDKPAESSSASNMRGSRRDPRLRGRLILCEKIDDEPGKESEETETILDVTAIKQETIEMNICKEVNLTQLTKHDKFDIY